MAESVGAFLLGGIFIGATVGAALKKVAVSILTNPKALKKVGIVVGSILLAILMPIIAIVSFFTGNFSIDTSGMQQKIEASLTAEQKAQMAEAEKILKNVESELKKKKCSDEQILQARVITVVILHDKVTNKDFVTKLANCFKKDQKTNNLISNVNRTFGTTVEVEDFEMLMNAINSSGNSSNSDIVQVAAKEIGNAGGEKYWKWYGFPTRVEWCCIFVSWCADQCGYLNSGLVPKYSVVDDGANWFRQKNQWLPGSATPSPGNIIFFDWAYDGLDGKGDHNPSQSVQMIERPLMTSDELKNLPKGTFVVMKTAEHPMKVKLKLFFKWGISFEAPYSVEEHSNRKVHYAVKKELTDAIIAKYRPDLLLAAKEKKDDSKSGGVKAARANKDVPFEQASHPAENKEPEKPAANKKSDKKDDSKSGSGNKRVIEQQKTQKPHTRPMQPRIHRNGGEQK